MNNMRLCHVFEEDYDTLEEVVVYQFGRMYELDSELAIFMPSVKHIQTIHMIYVRQGLE